MQEGHVLEARRASSWTLTGMYREGVERKRFTRRSLEW